MSAHIEPFRRLVLAAFDSNRQPSVHSNINVDWALRQIQPTFQPFSTEAQVEGVLPSPESPRQSPKTPGQLLFLPPATWGGSKQIPAFTWECDFTVDPPMVRLHLALFQILSEDGLRALAIRFDMPEAIGTGAKPKASDHHYPHVQFSRELMRDWPLIVPAVSDESLCPEWVPDSYPAFPLPVGTPAELLFCMLLSVYGRERSNLFRIPEITTVSEAVYDRMVLRVP